MNFSYSLQAHTEQNALIEEILDFSHYRKEG